MTKGSERLTPRILDRRRRPADPRFDRPGRPEIRPRGRPRREHRRGHGAHPERTLRPGPVRCPAAGRLRSGNPARPQKQPVRARSHHHDGVRRPGRGRAGHQERRLGLYPKTPVPEGARAGPGSRARVPRDETGRQQDRRLETPGHRREQPAAQSLPRHPGPGQHQRRQCPDHRRDGNGEGAVRLGHPRKQRPLGPQLRCRRLRRASGDAGGEHAVRPCPGRVHGRRQGPGRPHQAGRRGHAVPG